MNNPTRKTTVLFVNEFGQTEKRTMNTVPRIGDSVALFYQPFPTVEKVVWFPQEMLEDIPEDVEVLITVG